MITRWLTSISRAVSANQLDGAVARGRRSQHFPPYVGAADIERRVRPDPREAWLAENRCDAVAFGKPFIANPDLPERFGRCSAECAKPGHVLSGGEKGYVDYPALA